MILRLRKVMLWFAVLFCVTASQSPAQIRRVYDQGTMGLTQLLKRLNTDATVLMIGAHPDDEDTALLTYLARGENARTGYLSLTRGDGGQNIIGPELGEALGVIRTEELLQARNLDGAEQFFTRAYDYGFSKTLDEAKQKWDEKIILCDVVKVIRDFKPQVVIAQFNGTASDGHGQHQFAGYITPIALRAAADETQCTDAGRAWVVSKLYIRHRGQGEPTVRINTGKYDPVLGRSYFEIAMQARSQHRSQEQGVLELRGPQYSSLTLFPSGAPQLSEPGIFDGLGVTGKSRFELRDYDPSKPELLTKRLADTFLNVNTIHANALTLAALTKTTGLTYDVLADRETATIGDSVPVAVRVYWHAGNIKVTGVEFNLPATKITESPTATTPANARRETANYSDSYSVSIPRDAIPTQPHWLRSPRQGDLFSIQRSTLENSLAFDNAAQAKIAFEIEGKSFQAVVPVQYRFADDIRGEIRRDLNIVPKITVAPDKNLSIVSTRSKRLETEVSLALTNHTNGATSGKVRLILPDGWKSTPSEADFSMTRKGESSSTRFTIAIPRSASAGSFEIKAEAVSNGETYTQSMQTIAYEHIQTHRIYRPAKVDVKLTDLQTVPVKVGYIRGSGDRVPEAIAQLGLNVTEIDERMLASGDLSRFDTIVVGIRAYQVREDIVANNKRLLDFANGGGTLVVQYQLPPSYSHRDLTPFPTQMGPRVVDENAPVTIAEPAHPVFNFPNKITADDFVGWVQERNLYNFVQMDPKYVGLLESHDAGDPENKGGLVIADVGKGKYVYCSYSLFRQLPAGVPGAYRLLANLVSLGAATRKPTGR